MGLLVVFDYFFVLQKLISLRFKSLNLLLHTIDFIFELLKVLCVSALNLGDDVLVTGDSRRHFLLELMELPLVASSLFFLCLSLRDLEVQVMFDEL